MVAPTNDDVIAAFNSVGGQVVQPTALKFALEKRNFDMFVATTAINNAIADGVLGQTAAGGVFCKMNPGSVGEGNG